jgi:hypothetical protein
MSITVPSLLDYLGPASAFLFPDDPRGIPADAVPRSLTIPGSSSHELSLSYRVCCCLPPASRPQSTNASPGVLLLHRDTSTRSPLTGKLSSSCLRSALSVSHTLDGLLLPVPGGHFNPHATCEVCLTGVFPDTQPTWLIASSCSLDLLTSSPLQPSCPVYASS